MCVSVHECKCVRRYFVLSPFCAANVCSVCGVLQDIYRLLAKWGEESPRYSSCRYVYCGQWIELSQQLLAWVDGHCISILFRGPPTQTDALQLDVEAVLTAIEGSIDACPTILCYPCHFCSGG